MTAQAELPLVLQQVHARARVIITLTSILIYHPTGPEFYYFCFYFFNIYLFGGGGGGGLTQRACANVKKKQLFNTAFTTDAGKFWGI